MVSRIIGCIFSSLSGVELGVGMLVLGGLAESGVAMTNKSAIKTMMIRLIGKVSRNWRLRRFISNFLAWIRFGLLI